MSDRRTAIRNAYKQAGGRVIRCEGMGCFRCKQKEP